MIQRTQRPQGRPETYPSARSAPGQPGRSSFPRATMGRAESWRGVRIYTIGHSTRTLDELIALLRAAGISVLADIRTIPRSRHNPQFNGDSLRTALRASSLRYVHLVGLGGLRRARKDSPNTGWRNV